MKFNMNTKRRAEVLKIQNGPYLGGTQETKAVGPDVVAILILERFADPEDRQNEAPSIAELLAYMVLHPGSKVKGYVVEPERPDYRVTFDTLLREPIDEDTKDWRDFTKNADDKDDTYAWWD